MFLFQYFNFCWGQNSETYEVNVTIYILKISLVYIYIIFAKNTFGITTMSAAFRNKNVVGFI